MKSFFFLLFLVTAASMQGIGQQCIEGFVIQTYNHKTISVGLVGESESKENSSLLEITNLDEYGHFTFSCSIKRFPFYNLVILDEISDSIEYHNLKSDCTVPIFLLSNAGELDLSKDSCLSTDITLNVNAFGEWKRFIKFQTRSNLEERDSSITSQTRDFIKDSVEILMIKLFGTRTLNDKNLLSEDIRENPIYYEGLLNELQESSIDPMYYHFLEAEILKGKNEILLSKFQLSLWTNIFLILVLTFSLLYISRRIIKERKNPNSLLSFQERRIKELILTGNTNKQIGAELYISVSTVKTHISNIYQKLGVRNRKDLINK